MIYFFINLCIHLLMSSGILLLLLSFTAVNKHRKNKKGFSFLLPVVLTLIFIFQALLLSAPRVLDSVYVIKSNFQTVSGRVESVGYLNHTLVMDGETYYYNPFIYKPEAGDILEISYTPFAHYISVLALDQTSLTQTALAQTSLAQPTLAQESLAQPQESSIK